MEYLLSFGIFATGAIIGSFLNVLIHRLPLKQSILFPASHCPECQKPILFRDNIPIISYIILGGHCRNCRADIPYRYFIVEVVSATIWTILFLKFGFGTDFIFYALLSSILIVCSYTDLNHYRILNSVVITGFIIALFMILFLNSDHFAVSVYGMLTGALIMGFWAIVGRLLFKKTALGAGDIKLTALIGFFTDPQTITVIIFLAFFLASIIGIIQGIRLKTIKDRRIPLAPFISVATLVMIFLGNKLILAYLEIFK